eukprot:6574563-Prymnesium_polylepis.4
MHLRPRISRRGCSGVTSTWRAACCRSLRTLDTSGVARRHRASPLARRLCLSRRARGAHVDCRLYARRYRTYGFILSR